MDNQNDSKEPNPFFNHTAEQASEMSNNQNNANQTNNSMNNNHTNNEVPNLNKKNALPGSNNLPGNKNNKPGEKKDDNSSNDKKNDDSNSDKDKPASKEEKSSDKKPQANIKDKAKNVAKNTVKNAGNKTKNAVNNTLNNVAGEDGEKSEEDQALSSTLNTAKNAAAKTGKLIGKGLKKLFMLLPLSVKIIVICSIVGIILLAIIIGILVGNSGVDYESEAINNVRLVNGNQSFTIAEYVKAVVYSNYKDADEDYIAAVTIYIASNVYDNYEEKEEYSISENFSGIAYDPNYPKLPDSCKYIFNTESNYVEETDSSETSDDEKTPLEQCQEDLGTDDSEEKIRKDYNHELVDKYMKYYIETPDPFNSAMLSKIKTLSDSGKSYEEIIRTIEERNVEIQTLSGGGVSGTSGVVKGVREVAPEPGNTYFPLGSGRCNFQCVWYAANRAIEILSTNGGSQEKINAIKNTHGDGRQWNTSSSSTLKAFNSDPTCSNFKPGSIISWGGTTNNSYGHVAIIEKVDLANGLVYISEGWNTYKKGDSPCGDTDWSHRGFKYSAYSMSSIKAGTDRKCLGLTYLLD